MPRSNSSDEMWMLPEQRIAGTRLTMPAAVSIILTPLAVPEAEHVEFRRNSDEQLFEGPTEDSGDIPPQLQRILDVLRKNDQGNTADRGSGEQRPQVQSRKILISRRSKFNGCNNGRPVGIERADVFDGMSPGGLPIPAPVRALRGLVSVKGSSLVRIPSSMLPPRGWTRARP